VPLLGWFARTPAEDEALQRDVARRHRRGRPARTERDASPAQPPPGKHSCSLPGCFVYLGALSTQSNMSATVMWLDQAVLLLCL
jgi:hypothetical protein